MSNLLYSILLVEDDKEIIKNAFSPIRNRVKFYSYEEVESDYKISLQKYDIV